MKRKKLLLLGGLRYLLPVIRAAHDEGYYVITCDYLPDNVAHRYSDEYRNASIVDREAVLKLARELEIDGILSFGVDPGVVTAAYVQEQMHLPAFGPYESVCILQNKDRFRRFLAENGFTVPWARSYGSPEEAIREAPEWKYPLIVKPTDSAGSKGVTRVDGLPAVEEALRHAFSHSLSGRVIVEQFIEKFGGGYSSDSECFSVNGELKFVSFSAQRFDDEAANIYTPAAFSWPSTFTREQEEELSRELQRLLHLLKMGSTIYNVESRIGRDGRAYIMEVSPRGGGNRLAEMLRYATGTDLIRNAVRTAVGDSPVDLEQRPYNGHWAEIILHSDRSGIFERIVISPEMLPRVEEIDLWIEPGDRVEAFRAANDSIGTLVLRFETEEQLADALNRQRDWLRIEVKQQ